MVFSVFEKEKHVNAMERQLLDYMVELSKHNLTGDQRDIMATLMNTINDVERIGDHSDNIAELALVNIESRAKFSEDARAELTSMFDTVHDAYKMALLTYKTTDTEIGMTVFEKEKIINKMEKTLRNNHIVRLNEGACLTQTGIIFLDTISNLERIGDHSTNIAESIIEVVNKKRVVTEILEDN